MKYDYMRCPRCMYYLYDYDRNEDTCSLHGTLEMGKLGNGLECKNFERRKKGGKR